MSGIIRLTDTVMDEYENYSAAQEKRLFCEQQQQTLFSCGESSSTQVDSKESIAPFLGMSQATKAANSFDRRMLLLIASGLIRGIAPTSVQKQLGAVIPDFVSSWRAGDGAEIPKADY